MHQDYGRLECEPCNLVVEYEHFGQDGGSRFMKLQGVTLQKTRILTQPQNPQILHM
jgi:hypothetical protein